TANNANASTSVITKETVLRLFCERAKRAWQSISQTRLTQKIDCHEFANTNSRNDEQSARNE
ncbi:hypothetical protein, partial [Helicobacter sp. MIT 01-3238]|uniref:hypothetical protein n=1 Tax=Helicobacter sp. MIT 01-3238 TaxID=398627 RepID=UPI000E3A4E83